MPADVTEPNSSPLVLGLLLIILTLSTLVISFFCSLAEAVLLTLNPLWLKSRSPTSMPTAKRWLALKQRIERPIAAILIANTMANTGLATVAGAIFLKIFGMDWLWAFSLSMTLAMVTCGELAPKIIGVRHAALLAPRLLRPLEFALRLLGPGADLAQRLADRFSASPNQREQHGDSHIMDIITLTQAAHAEQIIHSREEILIIHAATLSARRVVSNMVPADSVKVFQDGISLRENLKRVGPCLHRCYPVSTGTDIETVAGYVRLRDILAQELLFDSVTDWRDQIHPVIRIGERDSLTQLLTTLLENRAVAAVVQGSDGTNSGWITLDDVMRILVGEELPTSPGISTPNQPDHRAA